MPVQHGGHLAGTAGPAGTTLAELGAGLGADLYLGHGRTPDVICSYVCVVTQNLRCAGEEVHGHMPEHRADHGTGPDRTCSGGALAVATTTAYPSCVGTLTGVPTHDAPWDCLPG